MHTHTYIPAYVRLPPGRVHGTTDNACSLDMLFESYWKSMARGSAWQSNPVRHTDPAGPTAPAAHTDPSDPTDPTDPADIGDFTDNVDRTASTDHP